MSSEIESLKHYLRALEAQTQEARKQLQKLLQGTDSRRCQAEISWDPERHLYRTRFFRGSETLYSYFTKKYSRSLASVGIERAGGLRPRVSWKDVDAGKTWSAEVILHEWYWDKYIANNTSTPSAQVIPFRPQVKASK